MAVSGTLNVTPDKLKSTATAFDGTGNQIRNLTQQMTQTVTSLSGQVWSGEAATKYVSQFNGLQDDIDRMCKMITEHVTDLNEMASNYESAESENQALASQLSSDVII